MEYKRFTTAAIMDKKASSGDDMNGDNDVDNAGDLLVYHMSCSSSSSSSMR